MGYYREQTNMPPAVKNLLLVNVFVFLTQMLLPGLWVGGSR
jgi:hypothetical protein